MALRSDWSEELCPVRRSLDVLGDPWVLLIIRDVLHGHGRFEVLHDRLGIGEAVLSRRLRTMVDAGLLVKRPYRNLGGRERSSYVATDAGADLLPVLQQLALWGQRHTTMPPGGSPMQLFHEACGSPTDTAETCSACGDVLRSEAMTWVKPWNGTRDHLVGPAV